MLSTQKVFKKVQTGDFWGLFSTKNKGFSTNLVWYPGFRRYSTPNSFRRNLQFRGKRGPTPPLCTPHPNGGRRLRAVEEAAELLEPQLLGSLPASVQHVILFGDHKQLRAGHCEAVARGPPSLCECTRVWVPCILQAFGLLLGTRWNEGVKLPAFYAAWETCGEKQWVERFLAPNGGNGVFGYGKRCW